MARHSLWVRETPERKVSKWSCLAVFSWWRPTGGATRLGVWTPPPALYSPLEGAGRTERKRERKEARSPPLCAGVSGQRARERNLLGGFWNAACLYSETLPAAGRRLHLMIREEAQETGETASEKSARLAGVTRRTGAAQAAAKHASMWKETVSSALLRAERELAAASESAESASLSPVAGGLAGAEAPDRRGARGGGEARGVAGLHGGQSARALPQPDGQRQHPAVEAEGESERASAVCPSERTSGSLAALCR